MSLSYANLLTRILQFLQDTGAAIYDATECGYWIEDEIKRLSRYVPHFVDVIFQVESRTGTDVTGTASTLTDATKAQFLTTDPTNEKVVHNIDDDTWAVILTRTSTSIVTLNKDIMDANKNYEIYNKRCKNQRQIYIGDMPPYLWIDSVEYPIGTERNFTVYGDILELDVADSTIQDSDSTLDILSEVDVLVKFAVPQLLCQLADLTGAVHTGGTALATSMQVKDFTDTQIAEVGEQFNIADHRATYIVSAALTFATQASTGSLLYFYPGLESATTASDVITFIKSTLKPELEEILADLVVARAKISDAERHHIQAIADLTTGRALINTVPLGGQAVMGQYVQYAQATIQASRELITTAKVEQSELIRRLQGLAHPRSAKILSVY